MQVDYIVQVRNWKELHHWLSQNCHSAKHCWVLTTRSRKRNTLKNTLDYLDTVEMALCFGWIDSTFKEISSSQFAQRLSPRRKNSQWSELNKERVRRLEKLGLMTDAGRKDLPNMDPDEFKIDADIKKDIKADADILKNFESFPELYKRVRIDTIQIKRNRPQLFQKRLSRFLKNTKEGKMYGRWNDQGRLLNY